MSSPPSSCHDDSCQVCLSHILGLDSLVKHLTCHKSKQRILKLTVNKSLKVDVLSPSGFRFQEIFLDTLCICIIALPTRAKAGCEENLGPGPAYQLPATYTKPWYTAASLTLTTMFSPRSRFVIFMKMVGAHSRMTRDTLAVSMQYMGLVMKSWSAFDSASSNSPL